jgi:hypothetical protein
MLRVTKGRYVEIAWRWAGRSREIAIDSSIPEIDATVAASRVTSLAAALTVKQAAAIVEVADEGEGRKEYYDCFIWIV